MTFAMVALLVSTTGMFAADQKTVIGTMSELRCDELPAFDALYKGSGHDVLTAFGLGYINGGFDSLVFWLEAKPSPPDQQALAKQLRTSFAAFPLSGSIIAANVRAQCLAHKDETVTAELYRLLAQVLK
jgi:hypothetical protein